MPGVLAEDSFDPAYSPSSSASVSSSLAAPSQQLPPSFQSLPPTSQHLPPSQYSQLSPLRHYIPVLTRSISPEGSEDKLPAQLSPLRRPAGIQLDVNALPDIYAEDGALHDSDLLMQLSPASALQFGYNGASPTTVSALAALRRFLPSNFEKDGVDACQYDIYSGDEFRMYEFKVRRCMRGRSHDWTECPFAHPGEKARRRDPRRYHYSGVVCADYKKGSCKKGDACDLAHGVFECWLHPTRYRTQPCKDGRACRRRICFFAHTPDQLRLVSPTSSSPSTSPSPKYMPSSSVESPVELFDLSGSLSPSVPCKMVQSSLSESRQVPSLASPPLAIADAFSAPSSSPRSLPFDLFTPVSDLSPHEGSMDNGLSKVMLPISTSGDFYQSSQFNHNQGTLSPHNRMLLERLSIPAMPKGSKSANASPSFTSAAVHTSQKIEDLVRLLRQLDLAQHQEPVWQEGKGSMLSRQGLTPEQCAHSVPVTPTNMRFSARDRDRDEMMFNGGFYDDIDDVGEPRLERVESGKGLRAQIFESLLSSASASGF